MVPPFKIILGYSLTAISLLACKSEIEEKQDHKERIVCVAKQYNEILYALNAADNLVGVDVSSTYPPEIKKVATVGYHRGLSAEAIISTQPTLIIHDNNIGPEHVVKQIEKLDIPIKTFSEAKDLEETKKLIREMGAYFDRAKEADSVVQKLENDMQRAAIKGIIVSDTPSVVIIHYGRAMNIYLAVTQKSTAAKMITWAGGKVVTQGEKGMQNMSAEVIAQSNPDIIFLTDFGYDRLGSIQKVKELPGVAETKAAETNRIYRIEEHDLIYFGPRTGENVLKIKNIIHPDE